MPARIDDLTCCRAVFACWVFIYHLNLQLFEAFLFGPLTPIVKRGYLGVDAFFMLSGLVLAHAHPALGESWREIRRFWGRRLLRIYPVHFVVIFLLALLLAAATAFGINPRDPGRFSGEELIRNLLLIHGWGTSGRWAWNYPSWSVSTEWAGYLAFPVLWLGMRRLTPGLAGWLLVPLLAALALVEAAGGSMRLNLAFSAGLARFVPEFLAGMALARCAPALPAWRPVRWLTVGGSVALVLAVLAPWDTLVVAAMFCVLAGIFARGLQGREALLARLPGFVFLGTISYSFYMSFAVIEMIQAVLWRRLAILPGDHAIIFAFITTAATLALAWSLWRFVELPGKSLYR